MESTHGRVALKTVEHMPVAEIDDTSADAMANSVAAAASRHGPVFRRMLPSARGDDTSFVYLVGPEANRFVLQTHREHFSHRGGWKKVFAGRFERGLLNCDDPEHARDRSMMNPAFTIAYMSKYVPIMRRVVEERTAGWVERREVDLSAEARSITFDVAAEALVGLQPGEEVDRLRDLFYEIAYADRAGLRVRSDAAAIERITCAREQLDAMLLDAIAERRKSPTDDVLGMLTRARDEEGRPFSDRQLLGQVHILLLAGHETTTTVAAWTLYLLAAHPEYAIRVRAELEALLSETGGEITLGDVRAMRLLGYAINEAGRLYPPAGILPRTTLDDVEFGGYLLPAGTKVRLSVSGGHRLPNIFHNPNAFDPDRYAPPREEDRKNPYAFILFGGGPRICIGINFAQVEIKILAAHVLCRLALERIPGREIRQIYHGPMAAIPTGIPVRVTGLSGSRDG
ncbi:MAG TPA: cytochrome P450 [Chloroflexota bacterium]